MNFPPAPTASFPYQIGEQVGIGSMGIVYSAREVDLDRTVAIKTLRRSLFEEELPEVRQEIRQRFLQEAQAAARLSHPGITVVHRVGEVEGMPYMAMEWLEGKTLEQVMQLRDRIEPSTAVKMILALLDALEAAHKGGVVHRDIKPSNLVLLNDGRLKVTDFGIARVHGQELVKTQAGVVLATPKFASPEQLRGLEVDGRADVFATGVLLFHIVSGSYPFAGNNFMELAQAILQNEPMPLRQLVPNLPPGLEAVIRTALHKERQDRYPSARQMADELKLVADDGAAGTFPGFLEPPDIDADSATLQVRPIHTDMPTDPGLALVRLIESWAATPLESQDSRQILERLAEKPLHTAAFEGAVILGRVCYFLADGIVLAAVDTQTGKSGDFVDEQCPAKATPRLFPLPANYPAGLVPVLVTSLGQSRIIHADLDSSFINLPGLAQKLRQDRFNGIFRLSSGPGRGLIFFVDGEATLCVYSEGWGQIPVDQSWHRWISGHSIKVQVEECTLSPLSSWFRNSFRGLGFDVEAIESSTDGDPSPDAGSSSSRLRQLFQSGRTAAVEKNRLVMRLASVTMTSTSLGISYEQAPASRFLSWTLSTLPRYLAERDLFGRFKYLAEWLVQIRLAQVYHSLPQPGSRKSDSFDLVTADQQGKVLHLAHRMAHVTPENLQHFVDRVIAAKMARKKTGDIGGVFLIAPHFDDSVLAAYGEMIKTTTSSSWFGVEESFTGYAGFVRIGPRRGFHLMLVQEDDAGTFEPLLPT